MDCRETRPLLETFVDGELTPDQTLNVEGHLDACPDCVELAMFLETMRVSTREAVRAEALVSTAFEARLAAALVAEREREATPPVFWLDRVRPTLRKAAVPVTAAAALLVWFARTPERTEKKESKVVASANEASLGMDQALDRLIDYHSSPPPAQITSPEMLPTFDRDVGVRVHAPRFDKIGASWEGASLVAVREHQAVSLRYRLPGRRLTVYVYDPRKVSVHGSLPRRMVSNDPVYVGEWRGYTVAAKENQGIGYAMASDLDDVTTTALLTEIH